MAPSGIERCKILSSAVLIRDYIKIHLDPQRFSCCVGLVAKALWFEILCSGVPDLKCKFPELHIFFLWLFVNAPLALITFASSTESCWTLSFKKRPARTSHAQTLDSGSWQMIWKFNVNSQIISLEKLTCVHNHRFVNTISSEGDSLKTIYAKSVNPRLNISFSHTVLFVSCTCIIVSMAFQQPTSLNSFIWIDY